MQLILTSSPCDDNVPAGLNVPCVFNASNGFAQYLAQTIRKGMRCLIIAASPDAFTLNDEMLSTFHRCFECLGLEPRPSNIIDSRNRAELAQLINAADVIILGGGHVPTQNAFFKEIGLSAHLCDFTGTVIGISAGSMNCAREVYAIPEEPGEAVDPAYRRFISGLGLCDIRVIPHLNRMRNAVLDGKRLFEDIAIPDSCSRSFYAIPDGSYFIINGSEAEVFGEAWMIRNADMKKICADGESLRLHSWER